MSEDGKVERIVRIRAPILGGRLVLMAESEEGKKTRSGLFVPFAGSSTEKRCERCASKAVAILKGRIAAELHDGLLREFGEGPKFHDRLKRDVDREFPSWAKKCEDFLAEFGEEGCGVCGGEGSYADMPEEIPGTIRAWVLSASEDCKLLSVGDFIVVPKHYVSGTEYVRWPERHLGISSGGLWVADDADRIFEWGRDKWLILTLEDAYPWVYAGEMGSALSATTSSGGRESGQPCMMSLAGA